MYIDNRFYVIFSFLGKVQLVGPSSIVIGQKMGLLKKGDELCSARRSRPI